MIITMDTANIISIFSLLFAVFSFIFSIILGFRDKAKTTILQNLKDENQLRQDFAERWFCTPIISYLASFQGCITSVIAAMHIANEEERQESFSKITNEIFLTIFDDMDTFCDSRGDAVVEEIKDHLSDFMDAFVEAIEDARKNIDPTTISTKRRDLLLIYNSFSASVNASLLSELQAIKNT